MKSKKHLGLCIALSALTVTSIVTPISMIHHSHSISSKNQTSVPISAPSKFHEKVNYQQVRKMLNDKKLMGNIYTSNGLKSFIFQKSDTKPQNLNQQQWEKVHELQEQYVNTFEKKNFDLSQIHSYIKSKFPRSAAICEDVQKKLAIAQKGHSRGNHVNLFNRVSEFSADVTDPQKTLSNIREFHSKLESMKVTLTTLCAVAAVAAAGFWASAWWFGISIPGAVACTAISTGCGVALHKVNNGLYSNNGQKLASLENYYRRSYVYKLNEFHAVNFDFSEGSARLGEFLEFALMVREGLKVLLPGLSALLNINAGALQMAAIVAAIVLGVVAFVSGFLD